MSFLPTKKSRRTISKTFSRKWHFLLKEAKACFWDVGISNSLFIQMNQEHFFHLNGESLVQSRLGWCVCLAFLYRAYLCSTLGGGTSYNAVCPSLSAACSIMVCCLLEGTKKSPKDKEFTPGDLWLPHTCLRCHGNHACYLSLSTPSGTVKPYLSLHLHLSLNIKC